MKVTMRASFARFSYVNMPPEHSCRSCGAPLSESVVDLGAAPLSNSYLASADLESPEPTYPLHVRVCGKCFLVQVPAFEPPERIFGHYYAYFSSYSKTWLEHCNRYAEAAVERLSLGPQTNVVEVASNDGCLLQSFASRHVPVRGIEPAANVAREANRRGIPTESFFLGSASGAAFAQRHGGANLVVANNVIAHVPDINDFVAGLANLMSSDAALTLEFPHVLNLIEEVQFDTIYHEHFSYLGLLSLEPILKRNGLQIWDVEKLPTHGGSLRVWACKNTRGEPETDHVRRIRDEERLRGLADLSTYRAFGERVRALKRELLLFLIQEKDAGRSIAAYGAAAKGNTLLNYCGIGSDFIDYVMDRNPEKIGKYLPGSRIPIVSPDHLREAPTDLILILVWNIGDEVVEQLAPAWSAGTRGFIAVPHVRIVA
jgi:hypothetical protein